MHYVFCLVSLFVILFCKILLFESEFYHRYRVQNFGFKTEKRTSQEEAKEEARCHTPTVGRFCYFFFVVQLTIAAGNMLL